MKIMITNISARPMCETSTLIFCRYIWYPILLLPHTEKLATPLMSPYTEKKSGGPLGLPPPPQSKTASGAPVLRAQYKDIIYCTDKPCDLSTKY